jgi:leader peptidase (prepilin peptidase)/N-methyltransferase
LLAVTILVAVVGGVIGLAAGSFLNVVIDRVPRRESVLHPRPHCATCAAPTPLWDNLPVLPYVLRRGRCRACETPVSARSPLVEAATGALFVAAAVRFGASWVVPGYCLFFASMLAISVIDLDHYIVPNRIIYPTLAASVPLLVGAAALTHEWKSLERAALGGVAGFLVFLVIHVISPRGMGFGDVRLAGLIGVYLGWLGYGVIALGFFLAFLLASVIGIGLMITRLRGRKDAVPFAPFMAMGGIVAVLWGQQLLHFYRSGRA